MFIVKNSFGGSDEPSLYYPSFENFPDDPFYESAYLTDGTMLMIVDNYKASFDGKKNAISYASH